MSVNTELRKDLLTIPELAAMVGEKVFELRVPMKDDKSGEPDVPFVWYAQAAIERARTLNDGPGSQPFMIPFDVEFVAVTPAETVLMGQLVRDAQDRPFRGSLGDITIKAMMVEDHSDDYSYRNPMADAGLAIASLLIEIYP